MTRPKALTDLLDPVEGQGVHQDATKPPASYPVGWQPGVHMTEAGGVITSQGSLRPLSMNDKRWGVLFTHFGVDADKYRIVEPVRMKSWDTMTGWRSGNKVQTMWWYQADFVSTEREPDLEKLYLDVRKARPRVRRVRTGEPSSLVVNLCDWQAGKGDGDGTEGTVRRIFQLEADLLDHLSDLRRAGLCVDELVVAGVGDLVEGCTGFYAMQEHSTQLDRRNQTKLVRRALRDLLRAWAPRVSAVRVTAVGGNHGENRKDGKAYTSFNDNDDVAVFEQVAEIFAENFEAFGHVKFSLPAGRLAVALEIQGRIVAWTHGHCGKRSGEPLKIMWDWWRDQSHGRYFEGVADAEILVAGHYHHLAVKEQENRLLLLCPTIEGASEWYSTMAGVTARRGTLTFVMTRDGWTHLQVV